MKKFTPQKMVGWYDVNQLAGTAVRAVLSSVFGMYADKRDTFAALSEMETHEKYADEPELWFDYISDTGDGFDSTFSMARLISEESIQLTVDGVEKKLPRGKLVIFGGDQVYPAPTAEEYLNRFIGPVTAASIQASPNLSTDLFAIPGNHDWYDGLSNFVKIFCRKKEIGGFKTIQNRSYFVIKVAANTWLWAIDIQLQSDVDEYQISYFEWVAETKMKKGDNVILCTAEPSWVYNTLRKEDNTYKNLENFEKRCIADKGMTQILTLAGDLHHYARYSQKEEGKPERHKITSGGGGAFLHPTHNLPEKLTNMHDGDFELNEAFPKKKSSARLTFINLIFPWKNVGFGLFLSSIHLIMAYTLYNTSEQDAKPGTIFTDFENTEALFDHTISVRLYETLIHSPISMLILFVFIYGFYGFCDGKSSKFKFANLAGLFHGVSHVALMLASFSFFAYFTVAHLHMSEGPLRILALCVLVFIGGGLASGVLVGIYLLFSSLVLKMHDNEAFSSMKIGGYKNFLRFHVKDNKLTIFPIGIVKAPKWKLAEGIFKSKDKIKPFLIDTPITIDLK